MNMELTSLLNHMGIFPLVSSSGGSETHDRIQTQTVFTSFSGFLLVKTQQVLKKLENDQIMFYSEKLVGNETCLPAN